MERFETPIWLAEIRDYWARLTETLLEEAGRPDDGLDAADRSVRSGDYAPTAEDRCADLQRA